MRVEVVVQGFVQGVGYRFFVIKKAKDYNLNGYVQNLLDGNVLIVAEGEKELLHELINNLKIGPIGAHVTSVDVKWFEEDLGFKNFSIKF